MDEKYNKRLPNYIKQQIMDLDDEGGRFQMGHKNLKAVESFKKALALIPEPKDQWNYTPSLLGNIGENYYLKAFFDSKSKEEAEKYYLLSLEYFREYMKISYKIGQAHNHRRIGQIRYELGQFEKAKDELMRAYLISEMDRFNGKDPKYFELIRPIIEGKEDKSAYSDSPDTYKID